MSEKPIRIQLRRTKGWRMPENTVIVSRPGPWGNPFRALAPEHAPKAVEYFRKWISGHEGGFDCGPDAGVTMAYIPAWTVPGNRRAQLSDLRGKNLACWCKIGDPCHADVLLEMANREGGAA